MGLGHGCKKSKMYVLQVEKPGVDDASSNCVDNLAKIGESSQSNYVEEIEISIHAILGLVSTNAMNLWAKLVPFKLKF